MVDRIDNIIFDSFRGQLNRKRQKKLRAWLEATPVNQTVFDQLRDREWILHEAECLRLIDKEAHWEKVLEKIKHQAPGSEPLPEEDEPDVRDRSRPARIKYTGWTAACLGLLIAGAYVFFHQRGQPHSGILHFHSATPHSHSGLPHSHSGLPHSDSVLPHSNFLPAINRALWSYNDGPEIPTDTTSPATSLPPFRPSNDGEVLSFSWDTAISMRSRRSELEFGQPTHYYKVVTPRGNTHGLKLPDGSTARLNAATSIKFSASYSPSKREVFVQGQTYFAIKPVSEGLSPFVVHIEPPTALNKLFSKDSTLKVVATGTSFDIRANPTDSSITIVLYTGKLEIQWPGNPSVHLGKGDAYVLDYKGHPQKLSMAELPGAGSWRDQEFRFNFKNAVDIIDELGRWYGAHIVYLEKPDGYFRLDGKRTEPIEHFLNLMKASHPFNYRFSRDTIYVSR
jgi:ferric-dicitrate binding protein FerR (iron transport regulator)